jgi:hypothetical protein
MKEWLRTRRRREDASERGRLNWKLKLISQQTRNAQTLDCRSLTFLPVKVAGHGLGYRKVVAPAESGDEYLKIERSHDS